MGLENEQSPEKEKQGSHSLLQSGIPGAGGRYLGQGKSIQRGPEQLEGKGGLRRCRPFEEPVPDYQVSSPACV